MLNKSAISLSITCIFFILAAPVFAQSNNLEFSPQISIPGSEFRSGRSVEIKNNTESICDYLIAIYKYAIGIIGIMALVSVAIGGLMWLLAAGNNQKIAYAKEWIFDGLLGLLLALSAFLILTVINKDLVTCKVHSINIPTIEEPENSNLNET